MVGDSILDLQAASAAGAHGVGASWFTSTEPSGIDSPTLSSVAQLRSRLGMSDSDALEIKDITEIIAEIL